MFNLVLHGQALLPLEPTPGDATVFAGPPLLNASAHSHIAVALTCPFARPDLAGAIFYTLAADPAAAPEFLDVVTNAGPSVICPTGWTQTLKDKPEAPVVVIVKVVELSTIPALVANRRVQNFQLEYGQKVALNLFRYLESYNVGISYAALQSALDKWLERFCSKARLDPNFVFKTD